MPLLPSALPPKGEARRYVANDFLNLIALPAKGLSYGNPLIQNGGEPPPILDKPFSNIRRFSPFRMTKSAVPLPSFIPSRDSTPHGLPLKPTQKNAM